ncbi:hypothetical protein [Paracidovorax valerianellae]|uniref:Uncharacterized protein n=1 Tax=Paracidovorax valerianellae TaxID=187868 RepID=A0A1G6L3K6_9BURK|nr:hypothetical protein [Paracidovorax valerianellae]MDA8446505.1 hypothetical protein [Paracidovorax valerianellae]SDC37777.1 hypothetical protein SAMN05192589_10257 [Paracidovorax valerianellae]
MPLTVKEIAHLKKKLINDQADDYPGLKSMVAAGKLSYKAGWYEAKS